MDDLKDKQAKDTGSGRGQEFETAAISVFFLWLAITITSGGVWSMLNQQRFNDSLNGIVLAMTGFIPLIALAFIRRKNSNG